jgi:carbonic anhydrase/acetyltransferase-like protein (isoleucine patch superfamily)
MVDEVFGDPEINPESYIRKGVTIDGKVIIEKDVIVSPGVSLRADEGSPFRICKGTNIQDDVVFHGLLDKFVEADGEKYSIYIGSHCSIAHKALIHGPTKIGKKTFVGFGTIIHNSIIGRNCHIGFRAIIRGVKISDNKYVADGAIINEQKSADLLPDVPKDLQEFNKEVVDYNKKLVKLYKERKKKKSLGSSTSK